MSTNFWLFLTGLSLLGFAFMVIPEWRTFIGVFVLIWGRNLLDGVTK